MTGLLYERTEEQVEIDALVLARVKRGIALLEKEHGPDWWRKINLDRLNLVSTYTCVLGQMYGSFPKGAEALFSGKYVNEWGPQAADHGFLAPNWKNDTVVADEYAELQEAWEHVLTPLVR